MLEYWNNGFPTFHYSTIPVLEVNYGFYNVW
jgi:hypothetical protein